MKRYLSLLIILLTAVSSGYAENKVHEVHIDVALDSLGNATICETWNVDINSTNTEWYLAKYGLGAGSIGNLKVSEYFSDGLPNEFITEPEWNINRSREEKAGRCGIVKKDGANYEICWGVGSNGPHTWQVSYTHYNLVTRFTDSCAFNHMFLSDGLKPAPDSASITIRYPGVALTDSIASVWAFGFHGHIRYEPDGTIVAQTDGPLVSSESMIVMAAFDSEIFDTKNFASPAYKEAPFSEMKDKAFKDSDYQEEPMSVLASLFYTILGIIFFLFLIVLACAGPSLAFLGLWAIFSTVIPILWGAVTLYPIRMYFRRQKLFKGSYTKWNRDIPYPHDLAHVPQVMSHYSYNILSKPEAWDNELSAAYIMSLIYAKAVKLHTETDKKGKIRSLLEISPKWDVKKNNSNMKDYTAMQQLYEILKKASGNDLILQDGELKSWKRISGESAIRSFYKLRKHDRYDIPIEEARQIIGLYNYLKDFSLSKERGIMEVALWDQYLIYATAFGIGDKVMKEMKKVAPEYFTLSEAKQFISNSGSLIISTDALCDMSSRLTASSQKASFTSGGGGGYGGYTSRSSGGGGFSSYHGGGGHTGGGGGGGR